ncbi:Hypothetical_protein [Hexamita inflata]|uniref:Hypothetical_protein n=1 Tax=Hexamita inflata TaxID=28002 RepID=A0AA86UTZ3_9EUKA|nr:Hypothetical protein HINF_LOCUS59325 [Hexamita inflata]
MTRLYLTLYVYGPTGQLTLPPAFSTQKYLSKVSSLNLSHRKLLFLIQYSQQCSTFTTQFPGPGVTSILSRILLCLYKVNPRSPAESKLSFQTQSAGPGVGAFSNIIVFLWYFQIFIGGSCSGELGCLFVRELVQSGDLFEISLECIYIFEDYLLVQQLYIHVIQLQNHMTTVCNVK